MFINPGFFVVSILFFAIIKCYVVFAISVTAFTFFTIDIVAVFCYTIFRLNKLITVKIASGFAVPLWNIFFGVIGVLLYSILLFYIHSRFPEVSKLLHFVIAYLGVSTAIYVAIQLITFGTVEHFALLNHPIADKIVYMIIYLCASIPLGKARIKQMNSLT